MRLYQLLILQILSLVLLAIAARLFRDHLELLLTVQEYRTIVVSGLLWPLLALNISFGLFALVSHIGNTPVILDILYVALFSLCLTITGNPSVLLYILSAVVALCFLLAMELIRKRDAMELHATSVVFIAGLKPALLSLGVFVSIVFGVRTADAIAAGELVIPVSLASQIERYAGAGNIGNASQIVSKYAEQFGVYLPITSTAAYAIIMLLIVVPLSIWLSSLIAVLLRWLLASTGWLTVKTRTVEQQYIDLT